MTQDEFVEQLLIAIGKCLVFIRPYPKQKLEVIKKQGTSGSAKAKKQSKPKNVDVSHYSTLSLIARLTNNGETSCSHKQLRDVFLWRHPNAENAFDDTIISTLNDVGLIERSLKEDDLKSRKITLTHLGKQMLAEIRDARRKDVAVIVSKLELTDPNSYQTIIDMLSHLGDELWKYMLDEVEGATSKRRKQPTRIQDENSTS